MKRSAKNFYYAFAILRSADRDAMFAVYAFCREADDIVDEGGTLGEKERGLALLRARLDRAFAGAPEGPVMTAIAEVVRERGLEKRHFSHVIDGCAMDLTTARYETFDALGRYLDGVASAVGRITMQVFGVDPGGHSDYAIAGGYAIQLTNILRDVKEDFDRGRVYLPQEDLRRFGVPESDLGATSSSPAFRELMRFEVERTRELYGRARAALSEAERRRLLPLEAIIRIYVRLLDRIERCGYDVLSRRVSVPGWRKATLGLSSWARARLGLPLGR